MKATVYLISNEPADKQKQMRVAEKLGPDFVFLSDPEGKMAALYAGKYPQGYLKPATIVVGKDKKIIYASSVDDFKKRPSAGDVLKAVKSF